MFERQGTSLAADGVDVHMIVGDTLPHEIKNGIHIHSLNWVPKSRLQRLSHHRELCRKALEIDADIYQISEPNLLKVGVFLHKRGKKVVFNMREDYARFTLDKSYIPAFMRHAISRFVSRYLKRVLPKYDATIVVTDAFLEITKSSNAKDAVVVTNFPIINKDFSLSEQQYLDRDDVLCYVGTVYDTSYQEQIFEALEQLPDVKYHIAGVLRDASITKLPYWKKVQFSGRFPKSSLPAIFANATISNVIRDYRNFAPNGSYGVIKIFESMEAALPIICTDVKINREIIEKYQCGICVDPNDVSAIKNAIEYLVNNKKEAYQMGQNGRLAVLKEYNWDTQYVIYKGIIDSIYQNK
jgi:glycosyltransferase involved in cell wall biosynthesis